MMVMFTQLTWKLC